MKIALITITNGANYGNRLQNYAMQSVLQRMGHSVETIPMKNSMEIVTIRNAKRKIKISIKKILGMDSQKQYKKRKKRFSKFNSDFITFSSSVVKCENVPEKLKEQYDFFVCGSDQIWNSRIRIIREGLTAYLAAFAPKEKKIAYAASFGTADIMEEYVSVFRRFLPEFRAISVREDSGQALIRQICQMDVPVVLDPTMLLCADEWRKLEHQPQYPCGKYIVTYILSKDIPDFQRYIDNVMKQYDAEQVIHLSIEFLDDDDIKIPEYYQTDPNEFLWLIDHAQCVLTDSFHSTVFSILFHKPFVVFERHAIETGNDMGSRIDTLLQTFGLDHFRDDISNPSKMPEAYATAPVENVLQEKRNESLRFLRAAILENSGSNTKAKD